MSSIPAWATQADPDLKGKKDEGRERGTERKREEGRGAEGKKGEGREKSAGTEGQFINRCWPRPEGNSLSWSCRMPLGL